jgi:hypothetical protein
MTPQEQRIQRMREAGIPVPITQATPLSEGSTSAIPVTAKNQDKHSRLAALKSGANRQKIQNLVKSKSMQGQGGFEGIPEPKMRKNPNHPGNKLSDPSKAIKPESFGAQKPSGEFAAMEAMYGGSGSAQPAPINMNAAPAPTSKQPELTVQDNGYGPDFDPVGMLAAKRANMQQSNQYMKHAVAPELHQEGNQQQVQQPMTQGQQQFDFQYMQQMMQEIAKNTISEVLSSYTEKNKDKLTYENVTKTKDGSQVIKAQDGNYYKLTQVKLKR